MRDEQVAAVRETATDGIDFDGLRVEREDDGHVLDAGRETRRIDGDLRAALADYADLVTNWYFWHAVAPQKPDRWAFLRWLERADGLAVAERYAAMADGKLSRTWGQLRLTVTLGADGERRYAVRHEDDADADPASLEAYTDPGAARDIAKLDADGRYRPLKTAPTLRPGWQFPDLDAGELVATVDFFYPATVANWHRERASRPADGASNERAGRDDPRAADGLDVTHWRETMQRQTGMYGLIKTWDRGEGHEHVEWVAEACCVDSQCLKRRKWQYDDETDLSVDGGDGEFPCREPCSVVINAARTWTKLEAEEPRTYEFELTPSEKEQLEEIVDAVADGRARDVREADVSDGANRYRARYLRAKLFDEDGNLAGVATDE